VIFIIAFAELCLALSHQLSLSSHTAKEYRIAIVSLFLSLVLAVINLGLLKSNIFEYSPQHEDKSLVKLCKLLMRKLLHRLVGR